MRRSSQNNLGLIVLLISCGLAQKGGFRLSACQCFVVDEFGKESLDVLLEAGLIGATLSGVVRARRSACSGLSKTAVQTINALLRLMAALALIAEPGLEVYADIRSEVTPRVTLLAAPLVLLVRTIAIFESAQKSARYNRC